MTAREHGTMRGYGQHRRTGELPCDDCKAANRAYMVAYRAARPERQSDRAVKVAAARALQRLARMHAATYRTLIDEERQKLGLPSVRWSRTA